MFWPSTSFGQIKLLLVTRLKLEFHTFWVKTTPLPHSPVPSPGFLTCTRKVHNEVFRGEKESDPQRYHSNIPSKNFRNFLEVVRFFFRFSPFFNYFLKNKIKKFSVEIIFFRPPFIHTFIPKKNFPKNHHRKFRRKWKRKIMILQPL